MSVTKEMGCIWICKEEESKGGKKCRKETRQTAIERFGQERMRVSTGVMAGKTEEDRLENDWGD